MPTGPSSRLMPQLRRVVLAEAVGKRSDGQLLGAFVAARDADAFAGLVRRHGPMVLGVCRRVTGDMSAADDAFQAVFLVLARRAAAIRPREQVGNWLYGVAFRTAMKARAVLARRRSREKQVDVMPEPPVNMPDVWSDLQPVIDDELARLPDKLRLPVVLCDLEGRPQREVAKHLGVPTATLATRLASARRALAERLTRRGITLSGGALAGLLTAHASASAVSHATAYSLAQAAEAALAGNLTASLVSPHVLQLSEGVIRMMLLNKLKAVTAAVLVSATVTFGLGVGLVPAYAADDPIPARVAAEQPVARPAAAAAGPTDAKPLDDETFLKRLLSDLRGTPPTAVETWFFLGDKDGDKRAKVIGWLTQDEAVVVRLAKKLGVPREKVRVLHAVTAKDGKPVTVIAVARDASAKQPNNTSGAGFLRLVQSGNDAAATGQAPLYGMFRRERPAANQGNADLSYFLTGSVDFLAGIADQQVPIWDANTGKAADQPMTARVNPNGLQDSIWGDVQYLSNVQVNIVKDVGLDTYVLQSAQPNGLAFVDLDNDGQLDLFVVNNDNTLRWSVLAAGDSDADFLKRVVKEARGTPPTALEEKYFTEDKDPKKREKLLDTLLKDPAVAKKLGDEWKQRMLATQGFNLFTDGTVGNTFDFNLNRVSPNNPGTPYRVELQPNNPITPYRVEVHPHYQTEWLVVPATAPKQTAAPKQPAPPAPVPPQPSAAPKGPPQAAQPGVKEEARPTIKLTYEVEPALKLAQGGEALRVVVDATGAVDTRFDKLVGELLAVKKNDAEMLEAVTLAAAGRLPTDAEKRLTLALVSKAADRKAVWVEVAKALAGPAAATDPLKARWKTEVLEVAPKPAGKK